MHDCVIAGVPAALGIAVRSFPEGLVVMVATLVLLR